MTTANQLIDHEVRIQLLERIADGIERRFDKLESKIDTQFYFLTGLIITAILVPVVLHAFKLV